MPALAYRPAKRSSAKPLIGLYAESGGGKTKSALLLARGFVGPEGNVVMIETEAGRGEAYAEEIPQGFNVIPLAEDFSPKRYGEAIKLAQKQQADALIIDSASHEWEGLGGVLAMAAARQEGGAKGQLIWQVPKIDHQRHFMLPMLQTPIPLVIICMRAKYPMREAKKANGEKEWVRSDQLEPKQADDILFELMCHGWLDRETHAFHATQYTAADMREALPDGQVITIETGQRLAQVAKRAKAAAPEKKGPPPPEPPKEKKAATAPAEKKPPPPQQRYHEDMHQLHKELKDGLTDTKEPETWWRNHPRGLSTLKEAAPALYEDLVELARRKKSGALL